MKKIGTLLTVGLIAGAGAMAHAGTLDVNFGSDNDGFGGFTAGGHGTWSEQAKAINFDREADNSDRNGRLMTNAFTGGRALSKAAGSSYTFTSVIQYTSSSGSGRSRNVSMVLFGADSGSFGITLKMLEARNTFQIDLGLNEWSSQNTPGARKTWEGAKFASGAVFTLVGTVTFTEDDAMISFTLTDNTARPFSDTVTRTIPKSSLSGDFHGVATRNRGLNFDVISFTATP